MTEFDAKFRRKLEFLETMCCGPEMPEPGKPGLPVLLRWLRNLETAGAASEHQFSLEDNWSCMLFLALLKRYELKPYRRKRQHRTTVMVRAPGVFVERALWPMFKELDDLFGEHLRETTERIITNAIALNGSAAESETG